MEDFSYIKKLGIICGAGSLPSSVVKASMQKKIPIVLAGLKKFAHHSLIKQHEHFWSGLGQIGYIGTEFCKRDVSHICFVGSVKRPSLLALKPDKLCRQLLYSYFSTVSGDNSLLTIIIKTFEEKFGLQVVPAQKLAPNLLCTTDFHSLRQPCTNELNDIMLGYKAAKRLGELDIGQSVIVQQRMIISVEGIEGTAKLIKRTKSLVKKEGRGAILVKVKKPNQDTRIDMPTIGLKTIKQAKKYNLMGIAIENGGTLVLDQAEILKFANKHNMLVYTIPNNLL